MNKYILGCTVVIVNLLIVTGCKKSFLAVAPQGQITEEQALIDPAAADNLVTGVYNTLYSQGTVGLRWVIVNQIASDDADKGSLPGENGFGVGDIDNFTFTTSNENFNELWKAHYLAIGRANKAIDVLAKTSFDTTVRNRLLGEVRFLRGMYYFNLVRLFGGVPNITQVILPADANNTAYQTRATKTEIYAIVTTDLQFAVDHLPLKGGAATKVGRANKYVAEAYLAKVNLYLQNWQQAYALSLDIINSGKYDLASNYATIFRESGANNIESVFEVETGPGKGPTGTCDAISPNFSNFQGPRANGAWSNNVDGKAYDGDLGFGINSPTEDLAAAYESADTRKAGTIITIDPVNNTVLWDGFVIPNQALVQNQRYNYKAYHSPFKETPACNGYLDKDNKPKNIRLMRFAEVLLINAEAALNTGGDAATPLNRVRARASLLPVAATQVNIWKERRLELAMETDRFLDIVRQGTAGSIMRAQGKSFVDGKNELFPIPQAQIDLSGNRLKQNPNY